MASTPTTTAGPDAGPDAGPEEFQWSPSPVGSKLTMREALPIIDAAGTLGIPVLVIGGSGIGKTTGLQELADVRGEHLEVVTASLFDPTDVGGIPHIVDGEVHLAPMPWVRRAMSAAQAGQPLRILLDELNTAPRGTLAALLRVLVEGVVGEVELPGKTRFVAAINPPESSTGGWEFPAPVAARFLHLNIDINADEWAEGLLSGWGTTPAAVTHRTPTSAEQLAARATVASFITANPSRLSDQPTDPTAAAGAWPTGRKWSWVAEILPLLEPGSPQSIAAIDGLVGRAAASAFLTYAADLDLPSPYTVLDDPASIDWAGAPAERVQTILASLVASLAEPDGDRDKVADYATISGVVSTLVDLGRPDVVASRARSFISARPEGAPRDAALLSSLMPILRRSGKLA